jgi:hypothetical protein
VEEGGEAGEAEEAGEAGEGLLEGAPQNGYLWPRAGL